MGQERIPGSNKSVAFDLLERASAAKGRQRDELIQQWIREVKYIHKIRHGWRRWMGALPEWAREQGGSR